MQHVSLGTHETEEEAARAYDLELAKLPGDSRPLNFPQEHVRAPAEPAEAAGAAAAAELAGFLGREAPGAENAAEETEQVSCMMQASGRVQAGA